MNLSDTSENATRLADDIARLDNQLIVVVTGAGISHASGIPTFRGTDPDAVWSRDVTELGTWRFFQEDPVASWQWYLERFDSVLDKSPNAAHLALRDLERWQVSRGGKFLMITQNVDTLHEDAGSRAMIKVHGSADQVRCSRVGCDNGAPTGSLPRADVEMQQFHAEPSIDTLPVCDICGSLLRQHVLWFDEFYDEHDSYCWSQVLAAAQEMQLCLFVGTSFSVGVTELFLRGNPPARRFSIDPGQRIPSVRGVAVISEPAEQALPALCTQLGIPPESR